jgi:hypothetical protein
VQRITPVFIIILVAHGHLSLPLLTVHRESRPPMLPKNRSSTIKPPQRSSNIPSIGNSTATFAGRPSVKGRVTKHASPAACEKRLLTITRIIVTIAHSAASRPTKPDGLQYQGDACRWKHDMTRLETSYSKPSFATLSLRACLTSPFSQSNIARHDGGQRRR